MPTNTPPTPPKGSEPTFSDQVRQLATFVIAFVIAWGLNNQEKGLRGFVALVAIAGAITWFCEAVNRELERRRK